MDYLLIVLSSVDRGALITIVLAVVVGYAWWVSSRIENEED